MNIDRNSENYYAGNDHVNFINWKEAIESHLCSLDVAFNAEWFLGQRDRLSMMYEAGESVQMAADAMEMFARGSAKKSTYQDPLSSKICIGVKYIN